MAWIMDTYSMHRGYSTPSVVTGKPVAIGGSQGRVEATGRGVTIVAREAARMLGMNLQGATVAIQGFGNVGSVAAVLLSKVGCKIIAASDTRGGVVNTKGLDAGKLVEHKGAQARWSAGRGGGEQRDLSGAVRHPGAQRAGRSDHR
jgi:glutamate dehydrogenase (NAD(P)+)